MSVCKSVYTYLTAFTDVAEPFLKNLIEKNDPEWEAKLVFFLFGPLKDEQRVYEGQFPQSMLSKLYSDHDACVAVFTRDKQRFHVPNHSVLRSLRTPLFKMRDTVWHNSDNSTLFQEQLKSAHFSTNPQDQTPARQLVELMISVQKETPIELDDLRGLLWGKKLGQC